MSRPYSFVVVVSIWAAIAGYLPAATSNQGPHLGPRFHCQVETCSFAKEHWFGSMTSKLQQHCTALIESRSFVCGSVIHVAPLVNSQTAKAQAELVRQKVAAVSAMDGVVREAATEAAQRAVELRAHHKTLQVSHRGIFCRHQRPP